MIRSFNSVYARIAIFFFVLLCVAGLAQLLVAVAGFREFYLKLEQQKNWGAASAVAERIQTDTYPEFKHDQVVQRLIELQQLNPGWRIALLDATGIPLVSVPHNGIWILQKVKIDSIRAAVQPVAPSLPLFADTIVTVDGAGNIAERQVIFSAARLELPQGPGYVFVEFDLFQGVSLPRIGQFSLTRISATGFIAILLVSVAAGSLTFFAFTSRFRAATQLLQRFSRGDYAERLHDDGRDELAEMSRAINKLADSIVAAQQTLESRDLERRELVANITHDLRNPLTSMRYRLEALLKQASGSEQMEPQALVSNVQGLMQTTELQQRLIRDLFELSKLDASQHVVLDDMSLRASAAAVVERMQPVANAGNITVKLNAKDSEACEVVADRSLVERAIGNLVENALRYSADGSIVEVEVTATDEGSTVFVRDFGSGVSASVATKLFEPGIREHSSPGAGLGLSIVKRIAEIHGSVLTCKPGADRGTVFSITFPSPRD